MGIWRESNEWVDKCMAIDSLGNYKDFILQAYYPTKVEIIMAKAQGRAREPMA